MKRPVQAETGRGSRRYAPEAASDPLRHPVTISRTRRGGVATYVEGPVGSIYVLLFVPFPLGPTVRCPSRANRNIKRTDVPGTHVGVGNRPSRHVHRPSVSLQSDRRDVDTHGTPLTQE